MISFLHEYHGHPFRLVELSALLDTMKELEVSKRKQRDAMQEKSTGSAPDSDSDSSHLASPAQVSGKELQVIAKKLFKKAKSKGAVDDVDSLAKASTSHSAEMALAVSPSSPILTSLIVAKKKPHKLHRALNILKSVRSEGQLQGQYEDFEGSSSDLDRSIDDVSSDVTADRKRKSKKMTLRVSM
ncbi:unnamed protein product [Soboliphyme baturini]|uniref:SRP40_C domain-containing protein n=1 Tax=Soboliphyme baturini TaxID=241478 RepID=A0A183J8Q3_9BILA|nr:unnamed protein product [Soboliphyme baturini]